MTWKKLFQASVSNLNISFHETIFILFLSFFLFDENACFSKTRSQFFVQFTYEKYLTNNRLELMWNMQRLAGLPNVPVLQGCQTCQFYQGSTLDVFVSDLKIDCSYEEITYIGLTPGYQTCSLYRVAKCLALFYTFFPRRVSLIIHEPIIT